MRSTSRSTVPAFSLTPLGGDRRRSRLISPILAFFITMLSLGANLFGSPTTALAVACTGSVNGTQSTAVAAPTTVPADGATTSTITVTLRDQNGAASGANCTVQLTHTAGGGPVSITNTTPATATDQQTGTASAGGVATFTVKSTTSGTDTFQVAVTTVSPQVVLDNHPTVTFTPGPATQLAIETFPTPEPGPGNAAGAVWPSAQQPTVAIEDANGNQVDDSTTIVQITTSPVSTLTCNQASNTATAVHGLATFTGCKIGTAGRYTLNATSNPSFTSTPSATFDIFGAATKLNWKQNPDSATAAGTPFATQPIVSILDANSVLVANDNSTQVRLDIAAGTGSGGSLSCTQNPVTAVNGTATFSGCSISKAGSGYQLVATSTPTLTSATSSPFTVQTGPGTHLAFDAAQQPGGTSAPNPAATGGVAFAPGQQPWVDVLDTNGALSNNDNTTVVTLTLAGGNAAGKLSCGSQTTNGVTSAHVAGGIAKFTGCSVDKAGTGYTLHATSNPTMTPTDSAAFNITVGSADHYTFTQSPSSSQAGVAFATQPVVEVRDAGNNLVSTAVDPITLSITPSTPTVGGVGSAVTCTGGNPKAAVAGVATFSGCSINVTGHNYQLRASGTATPGDSNKFDIYGTATQLAFVPDPPVPAGAGGGTSPNVAFPQATTVQVQDVNGSVVANDNSTVIGIAITSASGTFGAVLSCTGGLSHTAANGVATFPGCSINTTGQNYSLTATSSTNLPPKVSQLFNISGAATQLFVTQDPSTRAAAFAATPPTCNSATNTAGSPLCPDTVFQVQDAHSNLVTADNSTAVTLSITTGTPTSGGVGATITGCTLTQTAVAGVVTFHNCQINIAGNGYKLHGAPSTSITPIDTAAFNVSGGPVAILKFTTQPQGGTINGTPGAINPNPVVSLVDAYGNAVNPGTPFTQTLLPTNSGATLACTSAQTTGTAQTCTIDKAGAGYQLQATCSGCGPNGSTLTATSNAFNMTGPATQLVFTTQPATSAAGASFPASATLEDAAGRTVTDPGKQLNGVLLTITPGSGTANAALTCTGTPNNPVPTTAGVAGFNCSIDKPGSAYKLTATDTTPFTAVTPAVSTPFNITATVSQANSSATPSSNCSQLAAGADCVITLVLKDASNNPVPGKTGTLTQTSPSGSGSAQLTITGPTPTVTGADGTQVFHVSGTTPGNYSLTLSVPDPFTQVIPVTIVGSSTQTVSAANSTVTPTTQNAPADGVTTAPITVTLKDASGATIAGAPVSLTQATGTAVTGSPNSGCASGVTACGTTDSNGMLVLSVTSTTPGTTTFTVASGSTAIGGTVTVKFNIAPGQYHGVTPVRILDTRTTSTPAGAGPFAAGETRDISIPGAPTNATAVVLNVTAVPTANTVPGGFLTIYPKGGALPTASNLNFGDQSAARPNLVEVALGSGGKVSIYNYNGSTDVLADLAGYYTTPNSTTAGLFVPVAPKRLLDTRDTARLAPNSCIDVPIAGVTGSGVPGTGVTAVAFNLTAVPNGTNTVAGGFFSAYPTPAAGTGTGSCSPPTTSNVNFGPGNAVPNRVVVQLGDAGKVRIYNFNGTNDALLDINGYYTDTTATTGGVFTSVAPVRLMDTRPNSSPAGAGPFTAGETRNLVITGASLAGKVPTNATGVVLNVTVDDTTKAGGFLTVYPHPTSGTNTPPVISDLNFGPKGLSAVPNLVIVQLGTDGSIDIYNYNGSTNVIVDLAGWYTPKGQPNTL
ncbi:MAG: beta strand repeat-containing protein [Candidatus Dormibacteria bacterium]